MEIEFNYQNCIDRAAIYSITNLINGKRYIGKTVNLYGRMKSHLYTLTNGTSSCIILQRAFNKYGEHAFEIEILEIDLQKENLSEREMYYVSLYNTVANGYNILNPVFTTNTIKRIISNEEKEKRSKSIKAFYQTEEGKEAINRIKKSNTGRKHLGQALINIYEANRKRLAELEVHWNKGRKFSKQHRNLLSLKRKEKIGEICSSSILSNEDVYEIRFLLHKGYGATAISRTIGIKRSTISKIKDNSNWKHIQYEDIPNEILEDLKQQYN